MSINDSLALNHTRNEVIHQLKTWTLNNECLNNGLKVLGKCICKGLYGGNNCEIKMHHKSSYKAVSILAMTIPTLLVLCTGFYLIYVFCGKGNENEFGSRPDFYTQ